MGEATVTLHPDDAQALGVQTGDPVTLSNEASELTLITAVSDAIPRQTALAHKSRWPGHEPHAANINALHIPAKTDIGESTSVHGTMVSIRKA